jgi:NAD(P)-dependent dehydrogenase (short-subunit alcohol dehydrogenase family)
VVVITGAGNGIGEACAHRFTAEGAKVVLADLEGEAVERVTKAVGGVGMAADMTVEDDVNAVATLGRNAYGPIDMWFSNAGVSGPRRPGELLDNDVWQQMWQLHVMAHIYATRAVLPAMLQRGDGYLLQTVSSVALATHPEKAAYSVTKHAGLALGEWLALHHRPRGIKVSCFCPGAMRTRMLLSNELPEESEVLASALTPEQVADLLVAGIDAERFLILTPDASVDAWSARAEDYDGWLNGLARGVS